MLFSLKTIQLYLQIFNTRNYILFKISATGLLLECDNFGNTSLNILVKYSLVEKECIGYDPIWTSSRLYYYYKKNNRIYNKFSIVIGFAT